jgi:hypothetical protein
MLRTKKEKRNYYEYLGRKGGIRIDECEVKIAMIII